jgi:cytochrome c oxidase cbb3-type subunit 4
MDPGTIEGIGTIFLMGAFIALCVWAYGPSRRARFEEDARLPFCDDVAAEPGEEGAA